MPFDIGIGIILGLLFEPFGDNTMANTLIGIVFVLLPDIDAVLYYGSRLTGIGKLGEKLADHRDLFHYPLIFISVGVVVLLIIYPVLIPIFVAGSLVQFAHDSVGTGWGIPWLAPFSDKRFKFLYQLDLHKAKQPQKLVWVWTKSEQNRLIREFGDQDWHKHTFQFWRYAATWKVGEIIVLIIALLILATTL